MFFLRKLTERMMKERKEYLFPQSDELFYFCWGMEWVFFCEIWQLFVWVNLTLTQTMSNFLSLLSCCCLLNLSDRQKWDSKSFASVKNIEVFSLFSKFLLFYDFTLPVCRKNTQIIYIKCQIRTSSAWLPLTKSSMLYVTSSKDQSLFQSNIKYKKKNTKLY